MVKREKPAKLKPVLSASGTFQTLGRYRSCGSRVLGLQSVQGFKVTKSAGNFAGVIKSKFTKPIERYELIHGKINYYE